MHPYRDAPDRLEPRADPPAEEWVIGGLLLAVGVARVVVALAAGDPLSEDVTAAGLLGAVGLVVLARLIRG